MQTKENGLTSNFADGGIPFLDYHEYARNVFFPSKNPTYPVVLPSGEEVSGPESEGLKVFRQLMMRKQFLVTFIHTLEKVMSLKERYTYASCREPSD